MHSKSIRALVGAALALLVAVVPAAAAQEATPVPCSVGQPGGDPVTITGKGQSSSAPFVLAGGAYTVDWSSDEPTTALSFVSLKSATDPSVLRSETILNGKAGSAGQTHLYNVKPGTYFVDVRAPSGWRVTLTPMTV